MDDHMEWITKEYIVKRLKEIGLQEFKQIISSRFDIFGRLPWMYQPINFFISSSKTTRFDKYWLIYRLMISFDLFSILELFQLDELALWEYICRLYGVYHLANNEPDKIVQELLQDQYKKQRLVKDTLQSVIGKHCEIMENSLTRLHLDYQEIIKQYDWIEEQMEGLRMYCFRLALDNEYADSLTYGSYAEILKVFFNTNSGFGQKSKFMMHFLKTSEQLELDMDIEKAIKKLYQKCLELEPGDYLTKLVMVIYDLVRRTKMIEKSEVATAIDLMKIMTMFEMFKKCETKSDQFQLHHHLTRITLVTSPQLKRLWKSLGEQMGKLTKILEETKIQKCFNMNMIEKDVNSTGAPELLTLDQKQKQGQKLKEHINKVKLVFTEAQLLMACWVCSVWEKNSGVTEKDKILFVGRTKAGKSSLLKFLTGDKEIQIGQSQQSMTFFPSQHILKHQKGQVEIWDLPGLEDTKGNIFKLCIDNFIREIISKSKVQIWYLKAEFRFFQNAQDYAQFIVFLGDLLAWNVDSVQCLTFVWTQLTYEDMGAADLDYTQNYRKNLESLNSKQLVQRLSQIKCPNNCGQFEERVRKQLIKMDEDGIPSYQYFFKNDFEALKPKAEQIVENKPKIPARKGSKMVKDQDKQRQIREQFRKESKQQLIYKATYQKTPFLKLTVRKLTFAKSLQAFLNSFNIIQKAKQFLKNQKRADEQSLFIQLFHNMQKLTEINMNQIEHFHQKKLKPQCDDLYKQIHEAFKEIMRIERNANKDENKSEEECIKLVRSWLDIFFKWDETATQQRKQQCYGYLAGFLSKIETLRMGNQLRLRMKGFFDVFNAEKNTFKLQSVKQFIFHGKEMPEQSEEQLKWIRKMSMQDPFKISLLNLLEVFLQGGKINSALIDHMEQFQLLKYQKIEEKQYILNEKMLKLTNDPKYEKLNEIPKFNLYGQVAFRTANFKTILEVNAYYENNCYCFSKYEEIKIYCQELLIQDEQINIQCRSMIKIVAQTIKTTKKCLITVKTFYDDFASMIIVANTVEGPGIILTPGVQVMNFDFKDMKLPRERRLKYAAAIRDNGKIISRVDFGSHYVEHIEYRPPITYVVHRFHKKNSTYRMTFKRSSSMKLPQFGSLCLAKFINQQLLNLGALEHDFKELDAYCQRLISHIKLVVRNRSQGIDRSMLKLTDEHFSMELCQKLAKIQAKTIDSSVGGSFQEATILVKNHIEKFIYENIKKQLKSDYMIQHSKIQAAKMIQDMEKQIKYVCQKIMYYNIYELYEYEKYNRKMMKIARKVVIDFMTVFKNKTQQFKVSKAISNAFSKFFGNKQQQLLNSRLKMDGSWCDDLIKELKQEQSQIAQILRKKHSQIQEVDNNCRMSSIEKSQLKIQSFQKLYQQHKYSEIIKKYKEVPKTKMSDQHHIYTAKASIKMCQFSSAKIQLEQVSYGNMDQDYRNTKNLLKVLQNKQQSLFVRTQSINEQYEMQTQQKYLKEAMTYHDVSDNAILLEDIRISAIRWEQRIDNTARKTFNIVSFDSSPHNNGIVNVLFAAQLEKLTHRPINHMFDLICGKNESACIACCLALFKRDNDIGNCKLYNHYRPQFRAMQLMPEYYRLLQKLDEMLYLKKSSFKEYNLKQLRTQLAIVMEYQQMKRMHASFQTRNHKDDIYDMMVEAVSYSKFKNNRNPIFDVVMGLKTSPIFKEYENCEIVSFGTGCLAKEPQPDYELLTGCKVDRWQFYVDKPSLQEVSQIDYWDMARVYLEQMWIQDTKKIRGLIDRLEDRPYLSNFIDFEK